MPALLLLQKTQTNPRWPSQRFCRWRLSRPRSGGIRGAGDPTAINTFSSRTPKTPEKVAIPKGNHHFAGVNSLLNFRGVFSKQKMGWSSNEEYVGIIPLPNSHQQDDYMCRIGDSYKHSYIWHYCWEGGTTQGIFRLESWTCCCWLAKDLFLKQNTRVNGFNHESSMIGFVWGSVWSFPLYWMHHLIYIYI